MSDVARKQQVLPAAAIHTERLYVLLKAAHVQTVKEMRFLDGNGFSVASRQFALLGAN